MPDAPSARALWVCDLGLVDYDEALGLQRAVARARITGEIPQDVLLLCEHPPVVTLGRSSKAGHLLLPAPALAARGIALREVERGGDVTLHAPGQLVGYPVVDLKRHRQDLHWYLRQIEQGLIDAMAALGLPCARRAGLTGVWVADRKLASIGVHARDWVTWHGFALNVSTDLSLFDVIVPCGIADVTMTSVTRELGASAPAGPAVTAAVVAGVAGTFGLAALPVARAALAAEAPALPRPGAP
ncbi:MAG: lipoyl(octanoyl) transferase LipB [Gemmatimonadota bacterium]|jgi:lipoate-protein ligase B|nr:lipoyl(octanoyl) transferase LipB [Gemmatimonadota bacterium]